MAIEYTSREYPDGELVAIVLYYEGVVKQHEKKIEEANAKVAKAVREMQEADQEIRNSEYCIQRYSENINSARQELERRATLENERQRADPRFVI